MKKEELFKAHDIMTKKEQLESFINTVRKESFTAFYIKAYDMLDGIDMSQTVRIDKCYSEMLLKTIEDIVEIEKEKLKKLGVEE